MHTLKRVCALEIFKILFVTSKIFTYIFHYLFSLVRYTSFSTALNCIPKIELAL